MMKMSGKGNHRHRSGTRLMKKEKRRRKRLRLATQPRSRSRTRSMSRRRKTKSALSKLLKVETKLRSYRKVTFQLSLKYTSIPRLLKVNSEQIL